MEPQLILANQDPSIKATQFSFVFHHGIMVPYSIVNYGSYICNYQYQNSVAVTPPAAVTMQNPAANFPFFDT